MSLNVLRRRWPIVALVTAFALAGALVGYLAGARTYLATVTLQVPVGTTDDLDRTDRLTNTYKQIAESDPFRAEVRRRLPEAKDLEVSAEPQPNTELIHLSVQADRPELAQRAANLWATTLVERVTSRDERARLAERARVDRQLAAGERRLEELRGRLAAEPDPSRRAELSQTVRVSEVRYEALVQQAVALEVAGETPPPLLISDLAGRPTGAGLSAAVRNMALGLLLGLASGVGVAFLLERRAPQLDTLEDVIRATGTWVVGTIPTVRAQGPTIFNGAAPAQHAFSDLGARILWRDAPTAPTAVLVTSSREGDGKSLIAANLAVALARFRRRVLLVDANLRTPSLHRFFKLNNDRGLSDLLQHHTEGLTDPGTLASHTSIPNLSVLTSGPPAGNATELLASARMAEVIEDFKNEYEFVIVDSPGLAFAADAAVLASQVNAVMFVVAELPVRHDIIRTALGELESVGAKGIGVVVNRWRAEPFTANGRGA